MSFALCQQCLTPLTAYSGELTGENYQGALAGQVRDLNTRPRIVAIMAIFNVLIAIFVPLSIFIGSLPHAAEPSADGTYQAGLSTAFHAVGAGLTGLVMIPIAILLMWLAWATFSQRTWTWNANFVTVAVFGILMLTKFKIHSTGLHVVAVLSLIGAACLVYFWSRPTTRSWYGI